MSASTENAPVYNVMQQEIQMTQKNFQLWKSQSTKSAPQMMEGNQQFSTTQVRIMNEEAIWCQYNISAKKCSKKQYARGL